MSIVYGDSLQIRKQPTISSAATAYAAGDIMGAIQTLQAGYGAINGNPRPKAGVILQGVGLVDPSDQQTGIEILFFSNSVTVAADNAAEATTLADLQSFYVGSVVVSSTSYTTYANGATWNDENIGIYIAPDDAGEVYAVPVIQSAGTYDGEMTFVYSFFRDK